MPVVAEELVPKVFLVGTAIQQVLQMFDPFVSALARKRAPKSCLSEAELKKTIMSALAFGLGFFAALISSELRLLSLGGLDHERALDVVISGLVLGTGTEAANTVLKYVSYVKEWQKATAEAKKASQIEVTIVPSTPEVTIGSTVRLTATLRNATVGGVTWAVLQSNGGSITSEGVYAPAVAGGFDVMARSVEDPTKSAIVRVTVK